MMILPSFRHWVARFTHYTGSFCFSSNVDVILVLVLVWELCRASSMIGLLLFPVAEGQVPRFRWDVGYCVVYKR
ncbi:hypothetical protein BDV23DRAFT_145350 [Aspergillus alliaceus]|uniref:Uncharacterized protein n=1 Tax=Petromyces alliaceus TaxID=209559 RepID=A0A5N7CMT5_PETAA|nr:hypothetical protein BDV23DRAFT_145350 [Aspergillus alliaceus]